MNSQLSAQIRSIVSHYWVVLPFVLAIASVVGFYLLANRTIDLGKDWLISRNEESADDAIMVMADQLDEFFRQYTNQFPLKLDTNRKAIEKLLSGLASQQGIVNAYCITPKEILAMSVKRTDRSWLPDTLWRDKAAYLRRWNKQDIAPLSELFTFRSYQIDSKPVYFLGSIYHVWKESDSDNAKLKSIRSKDTFGTVLLVEFEPQFLKKAMQAHMDSVMKRDRLFNYNWANFLTPEVHGIGIINVKNVADTLWWNGIKTVAPLNKWYAFSRETSKNDWFDYRALFQFRKEPVKDAERGFKYILIAINVIAGILVLELFMMLFLYWNKRRLWLARETALDYLAHSLRTPISRIRIRGEILEQKRVESEAEEQEMQHGIVDECDRLNRTVMNSLLIVRGEINKSKLELCNLTKVIDETKQSWEPILRISNILFVVKQPDRAAMGMFHRDLMLVMIDNLLDNAFRAIMKQRQSKNDDTSMKITLTLESVNAHSFRVVVEDTGTGFDPKKITKLLKSKSLQTGMMTSDPGIGVGLRLVKEIVDRHNGNIVASNTSEGGARVEITFQVTAN